MKNDYFALKEDQKKAFSLHVKKKKKNCQPSDLGIDRYN